MILFGPTASPYVRKILVQAAEKGLALEHRPHVGAGGPDPDWVKASPFRKVPAFRDGALMLSDSSVIAAYIEKKHPEPAMLPAAPADYARALWFEEFGDTFLSEPVRRMFFHRIVGALLGAPMDPAVADRAQRDELPPVLDYLEGQLPGDGYLVGDALTLADISVASPLMNLRWLEVPVDAARWPKTAAFADRMLSRPSFTALVEQERRELKL